MGPRDAPTTITRHYLVSLRRKALRTGKYFKLDPYRRAILDLSAKVLQVVRSRVLLQVIEEIIEFVDRERATLIKAYRVGLEVAKLRVKQALMLGYTKAREWLKDREYIIRLGLSVLNTPPYYRPQVAAGL